MSYGSFQAPGTQYHDLDSYISEALAPGFVNALDSRGVTPKPEDVKRYKNLIRSCIRCRNVSKTFDGRTVPPGLDLTLKISIGDENVHAVDMKKKGDFIDIEYFGTTYRLHPGQIEACDIFEKPDDEILDEKDKKWEQYLIYKMAQEEKTKEEPVAKPREPKSLDDMIGDLKAIKC